jgi:hypothetical protein
MGNARLRAEGIVNAAMAVSEHTFPPSSFAELLANPPAVRVRLQAACGLPSHMLSRALSAATDRTNKSLTAGKGDFFGVAAHRRWVSNPLKSEACVALAYAQRNMPLEEMTYAINPQAIARLRLHQPSLSEALLNQLEDVSRDTSSSWLNKASDSRLPGASTEIPAWTNKNILEPSAIPARDSGRSLYYQDLDNIPMGMPHKRLSATQDQQKMSLDFAASHPKPDVAIRRKYSLPSSRTAAWKGVLPSNSDSLGQVRGGEYAPPIQSGTESIPMNISRAGYNDSPFSGQLNTTAEQHWVLRNGKLCGVAPRAVPRPDLDGNEGNTLHSQSIPFIPIQIDPSLSLDHRAMQEDLDHQFEYSGNSIKLLSDGRATCCACNKIVKRISLLQHTKHGQGCRGVPLTAQEFEAIKKVTGTARAAYMRKYREPKSIHYAESSLQDPYSYLRPRRLESADRAYIDPVTMRPGPDSALLTTEQHRRQRLPIAIMKSSGNSFLDYKVYSANPDRQDHWGEGTKGELLQSSSDSDQCGTEIAQDLKQGLQCHSEDFLSSKGTALPCEANQGDLRGRETFEEAIPTTSQVAVDCWPARRKYGTIGSARAAERAKRETTEQPERLSDLKNWPDSRYWMEKSPAEVAGAVRTHAEMARKSGNPIECTMPPGWANAFVYFNTT